MAVDKWRILGMLYVAIDLLAGRRLEGLCSKSRPPQSFGMVPEGSRIVRTSTLTSSGVARGNAYIYIRREHVNGVVFIIQSVIERITSVT